MPLRRLQEHGRRAVPHRTVQRVRGWRRADQDEHDQAHPLLPVVTAMEERYAGAARRTKAAAADNPRRAYTHLRANWSALAERLGRAGSTNVLGRGCDIGRWHRTDRQAKSVVRGRSRSVGQDDAAALGGDGEPGRGCDRCSADPQNRSLKYYLDGVAEPPTNDATASSRWLEALLRHLMDEKTSALVDLGGVPPQAARHGSGPRRGAGRGRRGAGCRLHPRASGIRDGEPVLICAESIGMLQPDDADRIVVTASHTARFPKVGRTTRFHRTFTRCSSAMPAAA